MGIWHKGMKRDGSIISWNCCIMDRDYQCFNDDYEQKKPVHIGKHVWIGHDVIISKGVTIGMAQ